MAPTRKHDYLNQMAPAIPPLYHPPSLSESPCVDPAPDRMSLDQKLDLIREDLLAQFNSLNERLNHLHQQGDHHSSSLSHIASILRR